MAETSVLYCYADIIAEFGIMVEWFVNHHLKRSPYHSN